MIKKIISLSLLSALFILQGQAEILIANTQAQKVMAFTEAPVRSFVTMGTIGSGKSTFTNALLGHSFSHKSVDDVSV